MRKVICIETKHFTLEPNTVAVEKGKIYTIKEVIKNPPSYEVDGQTYAPKEGDWYQFEETKESKHYHEYFIPLTENCTPMQEESYRQLVNRM